MGSPLPPGARRLMIALVDRLNVSAWSGRLPDVRIGEAFWAPARNAVSLVAAGEAEYAPDGTIAPPPEPPYTAHGTAGFAKGASNASP